MAITLLIVVGVAGRDRRCGTLDRARRLPRRLLLGETEYRHQIEVDLEPFKGLLLGLFFITVGMAVDVRVVVDAMSAGSCSRSRR